MKDVLTVNKAIAMKLYNKGKRIVLGRKGNDGILLKAVIYGLLISIGFVYLYPILYIVSLSFKSLKDLLDPTVIWLPEKLYLENFKRAWVVLDYARSFWTSVLSSLLPALAQTISCAVIGYGFAKFEFPGKKIMIALMIITFIIPSQVIMIPLFLLFEQYGMLGTPLPFIIPGLFGQSIKGVLFVLIYTQFFRTIPASLIEAAQIDGAGFMKTLIRIILPISVPAIVVVFLFSLVWHWNETYLMSLYLGDKMTTLPLKLKTFNDAYEMLYSSASARGGVKIDINEAIKMAGTLLIVLPLLILYTFAQKWFVEVVDKTGITGE